MTKQIDKLDEQMQEAIQRFLSNECDIDLLRRVYEGDGHELLPLWQSIAAMGLGVMGLSEEHGGLNLGLQAQVQLAQEVGRYLLPLPLAEVTVVAPLLFNHLDQLPQNWQKQLQDIYYQGEYVLHVGKAWSAGQWRIDFINLPGPILLIENDRLVLGELDLSQVDVFSGIDKSVSSTLIADDALCNRFDLPLKKPTAQLEEKQRLILIGELLGLMSTVFEQTLVYAKEREQFGKPIGANQAMKHRLADLWMALDNAQLTLAEATQVVVKADDASLSLDICQYLTVEAGKQITAYAIQVHGAMGVTWECAMHMYLKRSRYLCALLEQHYSQGQLLADIWANNDLH